MRKIIPLSAGFLLALIYLAPALLAQGPDREDGIWARSTDGAALTLDGNLDEAAWSNAEDVHLVYGQSAGLPTSGWRPEFQEESYYDQTDATVKFLVQDNDLWLGFEMADSSIGGIQDWARWDGILMNIRDRSSTNRPTPATEFFYSWWYVNVDSLVLPNAEPRFIGRWGNFDDTTRTNGQRAAWDARTLIDGTSNDDSDVDEGWTVEMRISLDSLGYDATLTGGDIVELNFSVWDGDWVLSGDPFRVASARTWWQNPWGNADANNTARVYVRPDVTINSGDVPAVEPDVVLYRLPSHDLPTIDGVPDESIWAAAYQFDIRWDDAGLRDSYPGVGKYRSGQFQPALDGIVAPILDGGDATIMMFHRDDYLYFAADVRDLLVQGVNIFDRQDAVRLLVGDRAALNADNQMEVRELLAVFDSTEVGVPLGYLPLLLDSSATEFAMALKPNTTINDNSDADEGYTLEMKVDLTGLGYPSGLGDGLLFFGVMVGDGDSFEDPANNYGNRTWFFREHGGGPALPWAFMDRETGIDDGDSRGNVANTIELLGNYPNPFNPSTTIRYTIPRIGKVEIAIYNILGQEVTRIASQVLPAGVHETAFDAEKLASGIYYYKIQLENGVTGEIVESQAGKMVLLK